MNLNIYKKERKERDFDNTSKIREEKGEYLVSCGAVWCFASYDP